VLCLILGLGFPSVKLIEWTCALLPSIIGAATVFPVYYFSKNILSEKNAVFASGIFAIMPFHILYTTFARFDHHFTEPLFFILIILFFIFAIKKSLLYAFLSGIIIFISVGTWVGSTIFILILGISVLVKMIFDILAGKTSDRLFQTAIITYATALPGVMLLRNPYWKKIHTISFDTISLFQPYMIWFFLLLFLILYFFQCLIVFSKKRKFIITAGAIAVFLIFYALLFSGGFLGGLFAGINFLGGRPPQFFRDFGEFESFITSTSGMLDIIFVAVILLIVLYGVVIFLKDTMRDPAFEKIFFLISTVIFGILTLKRARFSGLFSLNFAILVAYIFEHLFKNEKSLKISKFSISVSAILIFTFYGYGIHKITKNDFKEYYQSLLWLKENSPSVSQNNPEYGVLPSASEYGNAIVYVAERPTVSTNMHLEPQGLITLEKFFLETDLKKAKKILSENKIAYIILSKSPYIEQKAIKDSMYNKLWQDKCKQMLTSVYVSPSGDIKIFKNEHNNK
ncbi:MAG: glycosyltransferase family 39 protein, partial [Elusimicrobiota bacterium]|nr:glycosyltransferase family 39 protein [Elusimicrobiota bacterium]